jgi:hypothetical protein
MQNLRKGCYVTYWLHILYLSGGPQNFQGIYAVSMLVGGFNHLEKWWSESQWEGWHPIYEMENKIHVPNHQPVSIYGFLRSTSKLQSCGKPKGDSLPAATSNQLQPPEATSPKFGEE